MSQKSVIVVGSGLAGLSTASALVDSGFKVTVIERSPMAGGCTSSWTDHRDPAKGNLRKGNQQMGFNFYCNLFAFTGRRVGFTADVNGRYTDVDWWRTGSIGWSEPLNGYFFHDRNDVRSRLSSEPSDWFSAWIKTLPPPFNSGQILRDCAAVPTLRDKLSMVKFHVHAILFAKTVIPPVEDEYNFFGLLKSYGFTDAAIRFMRMITYSITNLSDFDQVGPKFMHLFYLAYLRDDTIGCRMQDNDCNDAIIDPTVRSLREQGVVFRFNSTLTDILIENGVAKGVEIEDSSDGRDVVCPNCGILFPLVRGFRFCPSCAHRNKLIPSSYESPSSKRETLHADYVVSALQPHQLAAVLNEKEDNPIFAHPYFQRLNQFEGARITVSRVHMDRQTTTGYNLTGLDRDYYSFNGTMDLSHVMPKFKGQSVYDLLTDDGKAIPCVPIKQLKSRLQSDLTRVFPDIAKGKILSHNLTHMGPEVLYHRPFPGLRERYLTRGPDTPIERLLRAGTSVDPFELGMESAVRSGYVAANRILELEGRSQDRLPILEPSVAPLVKWMQENPFSKAYVAKQWRKHHTRIPPMRGIE